MIANKTFCIIRRRMQKILIFTFSLTSDRAFLFLLRQARGQKRTFDTFTTGVFAAMLSYVMLQVTARCYKKFMWLLKARKRKTYFPGKETKNSVEHQNVGIDQKCGRIDTTTEILLRTPCNCVNCTCFLKWTLSALLPKRNHVESVTTTSSL